MKILLTLILVTFSLNANAQVTIDELKTMKAELDAITCDYILLGWSAEVYDLNDENFVDRIEKDRSEFLESNCEKILGKSFTEAFALRQERARNRDNLLDSAQERNNRMIDILDNMDLPNQD